MEKTFSIEVSTSVLEEKLSKLFKDSNEQHHKLIAKVILGNLSVTEVGLKQLYLAFSGYEERIPFLPGDEVLIHMDKTYTWKMDKDEMTKSGLAVDGYITAKVIGLRPYKRDNIEIKYMIIKSPGEEPAENEQSVPDTYLRRKEGLNITMPNIADII